MTDLPKVYLQANPDGEKLTGEGEIITAEEARTMIENFGDMRNANNYVIVQTNPLKDLVKETIKLCGNLTSYDPALRLYIGKKKDSYRIIGVPTITKKRKSRNQRIHSKDLEATLFELKQEKFFAYDFMTSSKITSIKDCQEWLREVDPSGVKIVFYTLNGLQSFLDKIKEDSSSIHIYFARVKKGDTSDLTLILRGSKGENNFTFVTIDTPNGQVELEGVYFDRVDLIPPPPEDGDRIDDSSFS